MYGLDTLKLDSNLLSGYNIGSEAYVTERATTNLSSDAVFITDAKILRRRHVSMMLSKGYVAVSILHDAVGENMKLAEGCGQGLREQWP